MKYYSINSPSQYVTLKEAVLRGLAPDKGLYLPEFIPQLPASFYEKLPNLSLQEIGFEVLKPYFCPDISEKRFQEIVNEALNFPIPTHKVSNHIYSLELFHGPTCAFKDVGARFMARILAEFRDNIEKDINILVATSGDTGSAVANGFIGVPGIQVFVLYPKGLVSDVQEKQFTTLGQNITALEVDGTFDDCQRMVKEAFMDADLNAKLVLTSANSINLARLLPQMVYYFSGLAQLFKQGYKDVTLCVPSGNFGNITAALIAHQMGLPVKKFIAATNLNDIVPQYLETGTYTPRQSVSTIANAMDVGDPSNFIRFQTLLGSNYNLIKEKLTSIAFTNDQIKDVVSSVYSKTGYILDPHGATAYGAIELLCDINEPSLFVETAHPAKFPETVEPIINKKIQVPVQLEKFLIGIKSSLPMYNTFDSLKKYLMTR